MPAPFPQPRPGEKVADHPSGFPAFFDKRKPRVITANVWAFLKHLATDNLDQQRREAAHAYLDQAFEFYEAAGNPRTGSKPLLFYYSFLNLAKYSLLMKRISFPPGVRHGIEDPRINARERLRLEGQKVRICALARNKSQLFPELVRVLGGRAESERELKVIDLLAQVPSVHRTFVSVTKRATCFLPVKRFEVKRDRETVWARVAMEGTDADVQLSLPRMKRRRSFQQVLSQVNPGNNNEIWYETEPIRGRRRGVDTAIQTLYRDFQTMGVWTILTSDGYRYYFCTLQNRYLLPSLASVYAAMFYFGSITRYKPQDFDRILEGGYSWLVEEFLATQPLQFLYTLASTLAGVEVVKPFATVS